MKNLTLIFLVIFLTFKTFGARAAEIKGIKISSHVNEFSVIDSKYAREIFLGLPVRNTPSSVVGDRIFRHHKYFFCVREPDHRFHCHLYLNGIGEGELSAFDTDTDFGKGSVVEFLTTVKANGKADISFDKNILKIKFDGTLARRFWQKLDLIADDYHTIGNKKYEVRKGKHLNCYIEKNEKKDHYRCQFNVKINTDKTEFETNELN